MVAVTYDPARVAAPAVVEANAGEKSKGFFARFFTRFLQAIERSQLRRAEGDLARYRHLLPLDHDLYSGTPVRRNEDSPFGGW
jgi:hypothetical protein